MFTGIIEEIGTVKSLVKQGATAKLQILAPKFGPTLKPGQSLAVNGVCLTVVKADRDLLSFELMEETLKRTNLGRLRAQDKVNLERALKADSRFDGHLVTGHIDGLGLIKKKITQGQDVLMVVQTSPELLRLIVVKGSVAVDGVSLTVSAQDDTAFSVNLIPYTLRHTTLGAKKTGARVNIECEVLAKYMDKMLTKNPAATSSRVNLAFLQEHGFAP